MVIPIVNSALGRVTKGLVAMGTGGLVNKRKSGDHPNIGQNTEKSPGDLRKLAVTQTPVEKHQLIPVWRR